MGTWLAFWSIFLALGFSISAASLVPTTCHYRLPLGSQTFTQVAAGTAGRWAASLPEIISTRDTDKMIEEISDFHSDLVDHLLDPFWVGPAPILWCSRTILQAQHRFVRAITVNPTIYPGTRSLQLSGDFTLLPALQMQGNGLLAKLELGLHRYTSWLPYQKV